MTSGLIYIAIIGMWVAYFAPRWIQDRNEFSGKSVERFKSALRVVADQTPGGSSNREISTVEAQAKAEQKLFHRRIIFVLIVFSLFSTVIGGLANAMSWMYVLVPTSAILIYIANVRRHTIADQLNQRRVQQSSRRLNGVSATNLAEVVTRKTTTEHWIPLSERELKGVVILPKGSAQSRNAWAPTSIPVPTYVNAPKAVAPKRVLDLTVPGQWSEEQQRLERDALAAVSPSRDQIFDQQLADEAVDRLKQARASNE